MTKPINVVEVKIHKITGNTWSTAGAYHVVPSAAHDRYKFTGMLLAMIVTLHDPTMPFESLLNFVDRINKYLDQRGWNSQTTFSVEDFRDFMLHFKLLLQDSDGPILEG